ncbi:MAG TPA: FHA domain-containing protein [Nitrospiraceae bacterium]|nr:FHA domain-containing protein [Nitrospiraceae bacterium]
MLDVLPKYPKLIIKLHGAEAKEIELTQPEFTIGRHHRNDLVVEDPAVSGHHARIVKIHAVYFLEDLGSTNGTFVNGAKIDRQQLKDTDLVKFGKHHLIFRDESEMALRPESHSVSEMDKTMVATGSIRNGRGSAPQQVGMIQVLSGRTDQSEYELTKHLTSIGAQDGATIKLTGWFAPMTAAIIGRRGPQYYIVPTGAGKTIQVNNTVVTDQVDLKDGDLLHVGRVKMYFSLKTLAK